MAWYDPTDWDDDIAEFIRRNQTKYGLTPGSGKVKDESKAPAGTRRPSSWTFWNKDEEPEEEFPRQRMDYNGPPITNPLEELYEKLSQIAGTGSPYQSAYNGMTLADMQQRAESLVASQYDPQIAAINRAIEETQGRADRSKTALGDMYGALSTAYEQDVPQVQALYDKAQLEAINRQKALQDSLNADYAARQASVNAEAAALGQQGAAGQVNQQIGADQSFLTNLANTVSEQNNANLGLLENANVAYTQQGARLAGLEGSNRQADLMAELEDYVNSQQGNIQGLTNARQSDYAKYLSDLQMQDRESQMQDSQMRMQWEAQQSQNQWSQMMDLLGIRMKMAEANSDGMSVSDQIAASRLGLDQDQASFGMNKTVMELALQIADKQKISFEEALQFVQSAIIPQTQR